VIKAFARRIDQTFLTVFRRGKIIRSVQGVYLVLTFNLQERRASSMKRARPSILFSLTRSSLRLLHSAAAIVW